VEALPGQAGGEVQQGGVRDHAFARASRSGDPIQQRCTARCQDTFEVRIGGKCAIEQRQQQGLAGERLLRFGQATRHPRCRRCCAVLTQAGLQRRVAVQSAGDQPSQ